MIRWNYVLPRAAILLALVLILWVGSRPLLKLALIHSGQSLTGAKVEIGDLDLAIWDGRIELSEVEMADPRNPSKNLLQAENAVIHLDPRRLLHREFVVDEASLSNIQFGTPRTASGKLANAPSGHDRESGIIRIVNEQWDNVSQSWLNQITDRIPLALQNELECVKVAEELRSKWPNEFAQLREQSLAIQNLLREFQTASTELHGNHLRDLQKYQQLLQDLGELRTRIERTRQKLHSLSEEFLADRQRLQQAKRRDQNKISERIQNREFVDSSLLSQVLLGEQTSDHLEEILNWIHWFRDTIPDPEKDFHPVRSRGFDLQFRQRPSLVFRRLHLEGQGRLAGQNFDFFGQALDVSTNPKLYDKATQIQLRTTGNSEIVVDATLDRRGPQKIDSFRISCPGVELPTTRLGNSEDLGVQLTDCVLDIEMDLKLVDNLISGNLIFRHNNAGIEVTHINEAVGGQSTRAILNENLAQVRSILTTISIQGELTEPHMRLESDLGPKFALSIEQAAREAIASVLAQESEKIQRLVDEQIAALNQEFTAEAREILALLDNQIPIVSQLEKNIPNLDYLPRIR